MGFSLIDGITPPWTSSLNLLVTFSFLITRFLYFMGIKIILAKGAIWFSCFRTHLAWTWVGVVMVKSSMNPLIADYWTPEAILGPLAYFQPSALLQLDGLIPFVQNIQYGASIMLEPGAEANIEKFTTSYISFQNGILELRPVGCLPAKPSSWFWLKWILLWSAEGLLFFDELGPSHLHLFASALLTLMSCSCWLVVCFPILSFSSASAILNRLFRVLNLLPQKLDFIYSSVCFLLLTDFIYPVHLHHKLYSC